MSPSSFISPFRPHFRLVLCGLPSELNFRRTAGALYCRASTSVALQVLLDTVISFIREPSLSR